MKTHEAIAFILKCQAHFGKQLSLAYLNDDAKSYNELLELHNEANALLNPLASVRVKIRD